MNKYCVDPVYKSRELPGIQERKEEEQKSYNEVYRSHVHDLLQEMLPTRTCVPRNIPEVAACGPMDNRLKTFEKTEEELFALFKQCGCEVQFIQYSQVELLIQITDEKKPLIMVLCFKLGDFSQVLVGCQKELWKVDPFDSKLCQPFSSQFGQYLIDCRDKGYGIKQSVAFFLKLFKKLNHELWVGKERPMCPGCNDEGLDTPSVIVGPDLDNLRICHKECVGRVAADLNGNLVNNNVAGNSSSASLC